MKRNNIVGFIRLVALAMFLLSIFEFLSGLANTNGIGFYYIIVRVLELLFGSVLVFGFSYIVDAACRYIERCENETKE